MTIQVRHWSAGSQDRYGREVGTWGPPQDLPVFGVAPTSSTEQPATGENRRADRVTLYGPVAVDHRDRVVIDGQEWEVDGAAADWNQGPFGYAPGYAITLVRHHG